MLGISTAAEHMGFHTIGAKVTFDVLRKDIVLPCIVYLNKKHFVVVYNITKYKVYVAQFEYPL